MRENMFCTLHVARRNHKVWDVDSGHSRWAGLVWSDRPFVCTRRTRWWSFSNRSICRPSRTRWSPRPATTWRESRACRVRAVENQKKNKTKQLLSITILTNYKSTRRRLNRSVSGVYIFLFFTHLERYVYEPDQMAQPRHYGVDERDERHERDDVGDDRSDYFQPELCSSASRVHDITVVRVPVVKKKKK